MNEIKKFDIKHWVSTDTLQAIVISLAITLFIYLVIAMPNEVLSVSMEPTFYEGDLLITNRTIQWLGNESSSYNYTRGDVVVFQQPGRLDLIKRIVGLPGEEIAIIDGKVRVNGQVLDESYLESPVVTFGGTFLAEGQTREIPLDSYFVMGDNRSSSLDSRYVDVGFVKRSHFKGKVIFRYWPLGRITTF